MASEDWLDREHCGLHSRLNPALRPRRMTVYFIQADNDGPIKIGMTAGDPNLRLATLQHSCPYRLRLLAVIPRGHRGVEYILHQDFAEHRLEGEWFSPVPAILDYIREHAEPWNSATSRKVNAMLAAEGRPIVDPGLTRSEMRQVQRAAQRARKRL